MYSIKTIKFTRWKASFILAFQPTLGRKQEVIKPRSSSLRAPRLSLELSNVSALNYIVSKQQESILLLNKSTTMQPPQVAARQTFETCINVESADWRVSCIA